MGMSYLSLSAACTVLSFVGLQWWTQLSLGNSLKTDESIISEEFINSGNDDAIELLLSSYATVALFANFALNTFIFLILCLKAIFFAELYPSETRKLVEHLINYVIYKGTFLPLVVPPTVFQAGFWSLWLIVLCSLKMFQALAVDRLERLNLSPSITPSAYFRVFSALLVVLCADLFWIKLCVEIYSSQASIFLLLFFEPCSIAFETLQAIVIHGFQLLDIWINHSAWGTACQRYKFLDIPPAGSLLEWKGILIRNLGFILDMLTLSMALGHYMHIWWLHGMAFHLVDAVLFLNIRALLSAVVKRVKGFIKLRIALRALHGALPDATPEELQAYEDECAICREPMAKAKRLNCKHLFHLACLRSWLDQGLSEIASCPTCRKPLFAAMPQRVGSPSAANFSSDEQLARQISSALQRLGPSEHGPTTRAFPRHPHNPLESSAWREPGLGGSWLQSWPSQGLDGAGPSTAMGAVGLGRVQLMMRQLASVGESYAHTALEDTAWNIWPPNSSHGATSTSPPIAPATAVRNPDATAGFHVRTFPHSGNGDVANILAMVETVREVLPHVPDELIFQDLQRTNSVTVTVNNLLQM